MILEAVKAYVDNGQTNIEVLENLRTEAEGKFKPGMLELTDEAITEAKDNNFDPRKYRDLLNILKKSALTASHCTLLVTTYKQGVIDLEKLFEDRAVKRLAALYQDYGNKMALPRLLLMNPGSEDSIYDENSVETISQQKTTFAHELFSQNCPRASISEFLKKLHGLAKLNPELALNYLSLSDQDGKSIKQILGERSVNAAAYRGLEQEIMRLFPRLYPRARANISSTNEVDTHTSSIHGSVDESFTKLALIYNPELVTKTSGRTVDVKETRESSKWQGDIAKNITDLKRRLREIIASNEAIDAFITPTLVKGDKAEHEKARFKFQAETALRLIDGLNAGSYGNTYKVQVNEPVSCGLTPKEIVAIGYASLDDRELWDNKNQATQQFIQFIEHLYIAKRGYNIDRHGDDEWVANGKLADDNKCTGGTINEIANGLNGHSLVEVKIITSGTMAPGLARKLPSILMQIATEDGQKANASLINNWLAPGVMDGNLSRKIIELLQKDEEFSKEFSPSEIKQLSPQVLNKLDDKVLKGIKAGLQRQAPKIFSHADEKPVDELQLFNFAFKTDKGYVPYLEDLFHKNPEYFAALLNKSLNGAISGYSLDSTEARKLNAMLNLLLASQDQEMVAKTAKIFQAHLQKEEHGFDQAAKNQYLILTAEHCNSFLLSPLITSGADINARDNRVGHGNFTALHLAAVVGHRDVVELLLKKGVDVEAKSYDGSTALHMAATNGRKDVVELLLKKGVDVEAKGYDGRTALYTAAVGGRKDVVELLLQSSLLTSGFNINAKYINIYRGGADTLLHGVVKALLPGVINAGHKDVVGLLLANGANIDCIDDNGETPLVFAVSSMNKGIVELLLANGANVNDRTRGMLEFSFGVWGWLKDAIDNADIKRIENIVKSLPAFKSKAMRDKDDSQKTLLDYAAVVKPEVAARMIDLGFEPTPGGAVLTWAMRLISGEGRLVAVAEQLGGQVLAEYRKIHAPRLSAKRAWCFEEAVQEEDNKKRKTDGGDRLKRGREEGGCSIS